MAKTIFFSWQLDRPSRGGRNFIENALERALGIVHAELSVKEAERPDGASEAFEIDRDTKGVAGTPPIVDTIFKKIDEAAIFLADMTFVGTRPDGRPTPNPNVLIEYGWALRALTHGRVIAVMNTAYGDPGPTTLPFDMQHLRFPITYNVPEDASPEVRQAQKTALAKILAEAIKAIVGSEDYQASLPKPPEPDPFVPVSPKQGHARFRAAGYPLGVQDGIAGRLRGGGPADVYLADGAAYWLRVMPTEAQPKTWTIPELESAVGQSDFLLLPMGAGDRAFDPVRAGDGYGWYASGNKEVGPTWSVAMAFKSGEVWAIETHTAQTLGDAIFSPEHMFVTVLRHYCTYLRKLGVTGPLRWEAGIEGASNLKMKIPTGRLVGPILNDVVMTGGPIVDGEAPAVTLKPFFDLIYAECNVTR